MILFRSLMTLPLLLVLALPAHAQKMTYAQAKQRIGKATLPKYWVGDVAGLRARFSNLKKGTCQIIATSPGGRPLHLVTFGQKEPVRHQANFNSAIGGRQPAAYMDKAARKKPVILFVGPVHGHEVEALTGLVNLVQVMETGRDLNGRDQRELAALGNHCRLLIIPAGNPDGIARFEPRSAFGMTHDEFQFWGQGTGSDNTIAVWPVSKRIHPRTGPEIGFLGCYFNDDGINPMHDEFFAPMGPEAPAILKVAMQEGPDLAVSLHSHDSAPAVLRPAYVPLEEQEQIIELAKRCYRLFDLRKLPHTTPFTAKPETGIPPAPFNLTSAMYHISGATSFTFECPHGIDSRTACKVSQENILDIQLSLYEAMMQYAIAAKSK